MCFSYFLVDSTGKVVATQEGVFRSNCMDCLDRTNVIQSLLARRSLQAQLQVRARCLSLDTQLEIRLLLQKPVTNSSTPPTPNLLVLFSCLAIHGAFSVTSARLHTHSFSRAVSSTVGWSRGF